MNRLMMALLITAFGTPLAIGKMPLGNRIAALPDTVIEVMGVIVASPSCQVNNDQPIDVNFGDIVIQQLDGVRYARDIPVAITCQPTFKGELNLKLSGAVASFNSKALSTSTANLAILLLINDNVLGVNEWQKIDWRQPLKMKAIPFKKPNIMPAAGPFTATGTLMIEVQ